MGLELAVNPLDRRFPQRSYCAPLVSNTHILRPPLTYLYPTTPLSLIFSLKTEKSEALFLFLCSATMGFASTSSNPSLYHTRKAFLLSNYILLGAASGCIFLTLSLRLIPSLCGLLLIFLHCLTAVSAGFSCSVGPASSHMAQTAVSSLTAIFQGAVALMALTRTSDFLTELKSYVREEDAEVILKMVGALGLLLFVVEWVVLALAFVLRLEGEGDGVHGNNVRSSKVGNEDQLKDWPWQFQV